MEFVVSQDLLPSLFMGQKVHNELKSLAQLSPQGREGTEQTEEVSVLSNRQQGQGYSQHWTLVKVPITVHREVSSGKMGLGGDSWRAPERVKEDLITAPRKWRLRLKGAASPIPLTAWQPKPA